MFHNRPKLPATPEDPAARAHEQERIKAAVKVLALALQSDATDPTKALKFTEQLLLLNPEFPSLWNRRRDALIEMTKSVGGSESMQAEMKLLDKAIAAISKSHCIWFHRQWLLLQLLERMGVFNLSIELNLCERTLDRDDRNFHCWAHRQFLHDVVKLLQAASGGSNGGTWPPSVCHPQAQKLAARLSLAQARTLAETTGPLEIEGTAAFTERMIAKNFSNWSAWHLRSTSASDSFQFAEELHLIKTGVFTEPKDQSLWQYLQWLLLARGRQDISLIHATCRNQTLRLAFSRPVRVTLLSYVNAEGSEATEANCTLVAHGGRSCVWEARLPASATFDTKLEFRLDISRFLKARPQRLALTLGSSYQLADVKHLAAIDEETHLDELKLSAACAWAEGVTDERIEVELGVLASLLAELESEAACQATKDQVDRERRNQRHALVTKALICERRMERWLSSGGSNSTTESMEEAAAAALTDYNNLISFDPVRCGYYEDMKKRVEFTRAVAECIATKNEAMTEALIKATPKPLPMITLYLDGLFDISLESL